MIQVNCLLCILTLMTTTSLALAKDVHSFANPEQVVVKHVHLDLTVNFDNKQLEGSATLDVERVGPSRDAPLILDTNSLSVERVVAAQGEQELSWHYGKADPVLGRALIIQLPKDCNKIRIDYNTTADAPALQWLTPPQTAGKKHPFLFTQSQAIDARSWVPVQDTPSVRITYSARIKTPKELLAVMSATNDPKSKRDGEYRFEMKQPIPAYLMALAVGDLQFQAVGPRTGVYAEPSVLKKAAREFADMELMMEAAETLYGPYRWDRYDVLIMPPSFPMGGMENPRLTFATPTVLAGDKSLVSLVAHELAHSWSGNLVTNATWSDFWLNEGFTVYLERRIMEKVYGTERAEAEKVLGRRSLLNEMAILPKQDQILHIDLTGRPPIAGLTDVPYEKGALFLQHLESVYGRERLDEFLKGYFNHFAFQSITTEQFVKYLQKHLIQDDTPQARKANIQQWLYQPGLPSDAPNPKAKSLTQVEELTHSFADGNIAAEKLPGKTWTAQEWMHFLGMLPDTIGKAKMQQLDDAFALTKSGNSEVMFLWLKLAIINEYEPAYARLQQFLTEQGRRKFLMPLYAELVKTKAGRKRAEAIYKIARPTYHPISIETIDTIINKD